jgi:glycosyltransferase involved in cell wall biosynthesis
LKTSAKKIAIVTTHPIQYNAPWFRLLNAEPDVDVRVFYTWHIGDEKKPDAGFGKSVSWDIPLLDGYQYELVAPSTNVQNRSYRNMDSPGLENKIENWNPNVVLVLGHNFRSHFRTMRYFKGKIPVWFRGDSTLLNESWGIKQFLRRIALKYIYSSVDLALAVGTNNRNYFIKHGLKSNQITHVPHAIDNERFGDVTHDETASTRRSELGFSDEDIVLLFAGKLESNKAPEDLAKAFLIAAKNRPELQLLFVGSGPLESNTRSILGDNRRIRFLPFQNQTQMPSVYRIGDVTCLPSYSETWGLCLNESMACGRAIIASDRVGATVDLVSPESGFEFQAGNVEQLAQILSGLPNRNALLNTGETCRRKVQDWSMKKIVETIAEQVRELGAQP